MEKSRVQTAVDYNLKWGYNCSQAVALTYADKFELDPTMCFKAMEAFGAGMGGKLGTCGALSGAIFLAGFKTSTGNTDQNPKNKSKKDSYALSQAITEAFYAQNKTVTCKDLKDIKGENFRSCPNCIADAAILVEKFIFPGEFEESTYFLDHLTF